MISGLLIGLCGIAAWLYTPDRPRPWLEARYLRKPQDLITIEGQQLHVRDLGFKVGVSNQPTLVLIHGFAASLHSYDLWADELARDYRVVLIDLPGQGLSGPDPTGDYSISESVSVISHVLDHLALVNVTLIGHSMGGQMAWTLAGSVDPRIARLVLIAPAGFESTDQAYGQTVNLPGFVNLLEWCLPRILVAQGLAGAFGDPQRLTDSIIDRFWNLLRAPGNRHATIERLRQYKIADPVPMLRNIQIPTLIMWGTSDQLIPVSNAADYMQHLAHATLRTYDGIGHVPMEELADVTLRDLRVFLAQTDLTNSQGIGQ